MYGNERAIELKVRQLGMNLNRAFLPDELLSEAQKATYEYVRSREMMDVMSTCDATLDVHSSPTAGSPVFAICEPNAFAIVENFPCSIRCSGFDAVEPGSTEYSMNSIGKVGVGVECGNHADPQAFERAKACAYAFLAHFGMVDVPTRKIAQASYRAASKYLTKTDSFKVVRRFADFERIER